MLMIDADKLFPLQYQITLLESDEGFAAWCDDLPGCSSQGATREEALSNIRIAIQEWMDCAGRD